MNTASSSGMEAQAPASWVLYDASCAKCTALAAKFRKPLRRRGYITAPLQSMWVPAALQMTPAELLKEMRVFTARGEIYGGADAVLHLAREFWWARPLRWLVQLPGGKRMMRALYVWIADHRHCSAGVCRRADPSSGGTARSCVADRSQHDTNREVRNDASN